jgi:DNA-binding response OmpR family regulator
LLVDDEAYLTEIVSRGLQKAGASVLIERNGEDMCRSAESNRPDLIITDYQMPVLDGFAASKRLKQNPATAGIPVILLTARSHRLAASEMAQTNICCTLPKPMSFKHLLAQVERLLGADVQAAPALAGNSVGAIVK